MASVVVGWKVCPRQFVFPVVAFEAHGPWCKFVEYQMSNVKYQANFTDVLKCWLNCATLLCNFIYSALGCSVHG